MHTERARAIARQIAVSVAEVRVLRKVNIPVWKRMHAAADNREKVLFKHFERAFQKAIAPVTELPQDHIGLEVTMNDVILRLEKELQKGLVGLLLDSLEEGGHAAAANLKHAMIRSAGDVVGHEFHGNQWTSEGGRERPVGSGKKVRPVTEADRAALEKTAFARVFAREIAEKPDGNKTVFSRGRDDEGFKDQVFGKEDPNELVAKIAENIPGNVHARWTAGVGNHDNVDKIILEIQSDHGVKIDRMFTYDENKELVAHHEYFTIPAGEQGKGVGTDVTRELFKTYDKIGVSKVETLANLENGAYTWAKMGFKAEKPELLAKHIEYTLDSEARFKPEQDAAIRKIIDTHRKDPTLPWHIAGITDNAGNKLGKTLLDNQSYPATFSLKDQESKDRLNAYLNKAKK